MQYIFSGVLMQNIVYAGDARISHYDLDKNGNIKLSALLRMIHAAADINAASLGIGYTQLSGLNMTFVLQRIGFKFTRLPKYSEIVTIKTWPSEISKGMFLRLGSMHDANNKLIEWASQWILFDLASRKILKPSALPIKVPEFTDMGVTVRPEKIAQPTSEGAIYSNYVHTVRYADVDTNNHMNNSVYGDLVGNAVFADSSMDSRKFSEVHINYFAEAKNGEKINVTAQKHGDIIYISGEMESKKNFAARLRICNGYN